MGAGTGRSAVLGRGAEEVLAVVVREEGRLEEVGPVAAIVVVVGRLATLRLLSSGLAVVRGGTAALGLVVPLVLPAVTVLALFNPVDGAADPVGLALAMDSRALVEVV